MDERHAFLSRESNRVNDILDEIESFKNKIFEYKNKIESEKLVKQTLDEINRYKKLNIELDEIETIINSIEAKEKSIKKLNKKSEKLYNKLTDEFPMTCPLCGHTV
jgi:DNA repair exonuclease SbcCD ATPase subunit